MKNITLVLLCLFVIKAQSQDSAKAKAPKTLKRHEIGLNLLPILLVAAGSTESQPNFFNVTYRYFLSEHNALRATAGLNVFNPKENNYNTNYQNIVSSANGLTVYQTSSSRSPANFQVGMGYERIIGKRKLKHVIGFDLTYNYATKITSSQFFGLKDTIYNNSQHVEYVQIDTGRVISNTSFHKVGVTPFYSIRYALSSKWLISASTRFNFQAYTIKNGNYPEIKLVDFNVSGLISEISLFYRF